MKGLIAAIPLLFFVASVKAQERVSTCAVVPERQLIWVDSTGREEPLPLAPQAFTSARLSPDGRHVVASIYACDDRDEDIWVVDLATGTQTQLTSGNGPNETPIWTPDGKRVAFRSRHGGVAWRLADGTGPIEELTSDLLSLGRGHFPSAFSPDGTVLFFSRRRAPTTDAYMLSLGTDRRVTPLLTSSYDDESQLALSPNGRWLAYASGESGSPGIYLRPFPNTDDGSRRISSGVGIEPVWSPDGRLLYYRSGDLLVAVDIDPDRGVSVSRPSVVFTGYFSSMPYLPSYSISPDGQRFLIIKGER